MNRRGEGSKTKSVKAPQGSHTVKEAEREKPAHCGSYCNSSSVRGTQERNPSTGLRSPNGGPRLVKGQRPSG